ncbi:Phosphorylated adapter RNA export protein [Bienertia sinuspersici]
MEIGESILDCIDEELSFEDVDMMDTEEGEVVDGHIYQKSAHINDNQVKSNSHAQPLNNVSNMRNKKKKKKKKKHKNKKAMPKSDGVDIDSFVMGVCKRLRERKSYLVYTAVGVLGISALRDFVQEVDAVQACGGQKTALGDRFRSGGGILWNILKARNPNAFKEIMQKGKEFEKQFRRPFSNAQPPGPSCAITSKPMASTSDDVELEPAELSVQPIIEEKRSSVHDRIRVPVSYDDLSGEDPPKDHSS